MKNSVSLTAGAYLHFAHAYGFKNGDNDGGVLEYSTNGGSSWNDAGSLIEINSYDGPLGGGTGNPLAGRPAFMGDSHGYISSRLNLASLAGQNVRFRWRMALDNGGYDLGWWLDDVRIYRCASSNLVKTTYVPLLLKAPLPLVNGNFESGSAGWTQFSSNGFGLILPANQFPGSVTPHSGSYAVWLGGSLNEISYIQQQILVPADKPYLAYWHWIASQDFCGFDFGGVRINSTTVSSYDLCSSKNTNGWVKRVVNLSSYSGQSVSLQIRAETDSALNSNLFIDDVSFQASAATLETSAADGSTSEEAAALKLFEPDGPAAEEAEFLLRPAGWKPR
jgi:hypothetical protein